MKSFSKPSFIHFLSIIHPSTTLIFHPSSRNQSLHTFIVIHPLYSNPSLLSIYLFIHPTRVLCYFSFWKISEVNLSWIRSLPQLKFQLCEDVREPLKNPHWPRRNIWPQDQNIAIVRRNQEAATSWTGKKSRLLEVNKLKLCIREDTDIRKHTCVTSAGTQENTSSGTQGTLSAVNLSDTSGLTGTATPPQNSCWHDSGWQLEPLKKNSDASPNLQLYREKTGSVCLLSAFEECYFTGTDEWSSVVFLSLNSAAIKHREPIKLLNSVCCPGFVVVILDEFFFLLLTYLILHWWKQKSASSRPQQMELECDVEKLRVLAEGLQKALTRLQWKNKIK